MKATCIKAGFATSVRFLFVLGAVLWAASPATLADEARFFRIVGPGETTITSITRDGYVTWTNAVTNVTCTVQTAVSLVGPGNWVDYVQVPVSNYVTTLRFYDPNPPSGMVFIPAGSFRMGNCMNPNEGYSDELPLHTNYISPFYMDRNLVTYALWLEVYQWATNNGYNVDNVGSGKAPHHPVQTINWYDMVKWCNARSEKEGLVPAYYTSVGQTDVYRTGQTSLASGWVKWNAGYRLPTEAEWEKAARGGASGHRFPWSDSDTIQHSRANYYSTNSYSYDTSSTRGYHPTFNDAVTPYTSPVGYFAANGYGLYDMAGNVWQWCWDWYNPTYYGSSPRTDPRGPASGTYGTRVMRGGAWNFDASYARCSYRVSNSPSGAKDSKGFRCVRGL